MEYPTLSRSTSKTTGLSAYTYSAMAQRIKRLGKAANFKKPLDFYNLRYSICALDKLDNLPNDLAALIRSDACVSYALGPSRPCMPARANMASPFG